MPKNTSALAWGLHCFEPGPLLLEFIIVEKDSRTSLPHPTEDAIKQACRKHNIDADQVLRLIEGKNANVHTILLDAPVFRGDDQE